MPRLPMLGCLVLVSSGLAAQAPAAGLASPRRVFDPADPWWEAESPAWSPSHALSSTDQVDQLPDSVDRISIVLGTEGSAATVERALKRRPLHQLWLVQGGPLRHEIPWGDLLAHTELRRLGMIATTAVGGDELRELRRLPELGSLTLSHGSLRLDSATAAALRELRGLRHLDLAYDEVDPEALATLAELPELESLVLGNSNDRAVDHVAVITSAARIRTLRSLRYDGDLEPLPAEALAALPALEQLVALQLCNFQVDDECLAALPRTLQHLTFSVFSPVTPRGLGSLARIASLRSLSLHGAVPEQLEPALAELLPKLPLESVELMDGLPDEALWPVLERLPLLRRLRVALPEDAQPNALFEHCLALRRLEVLFVSLGVLPTPDQLRALGKHRALRRIVVRCSSATMAQPTAAELAALRASVDCVVELR